MTTPNPEAQAIAALGNRFLENGSAHYAASPIPVEDVHIEFPISGDDTTLVWAPIDVLLERIKAQAKIDANS